MTESRVRYGQEVADHIICRKCHPPTTFATSPPVTMSAVICPVCVGRGTVAAGFYPTNRSNFHSVTTTDTGETCRSCNGKGYVQ